MACSDQLRHNDSEPSKEKPEEPMPVAEEDLKDQGESSTAEAPVDSVPEIPEATLPQPAGKT